MSGGEKVDSFNPFMILIWIFNIIIFFIDLQDGEIFWSLGIIGSILIIQIYFIWRTNYDEMREEQSEAQARALGGPMDTPEIQPGQTDLSEVHGTSSSQKKPSDQMVNLNVSSSESQSSDDEEENEQ